MKNWELILYKRVRTREKIKNKGKKSVKTRKTNFSRPTKNLNRGWKHADV